MRLFITTLTASIFSLSMAFAQEETQPNRILFTNVNVFDGVSKSLEMNTNVLVEGNLIKSVGASINLPDGAEVIDGGGRTLMPGMIDSHVHSNMYKDGTIPGFQDTTPNLCRADRWHLYQHPVSRMALCYLCNPGRPHFVPNAQAATVGY